MSAYEQPLVSVVTPVYNGEAFLAECIESVLRQTYINYEYIIVNNCSTDRSSEIAASYARNDSRIRVHNNDQFLDVIANHNHAFNLISPSADFCKVVSADDFIFPDCLKCMVEVAAAHPSIAMVGSYQQSGTSVRWQGFRYPLAVMQGSQVCRDIFLGDRPDFGFGSPTSLLYRADIVRSRNQFYPNASPHADTSACFKELRNRDFGFVYQVLSYERTHTETQSYRSAQLNRYLSAGLNDLLQYGRFYLSESEFEHLVKVWIKNYHRFLAINCFSGPHEAVFWSYHKGRLSELGYPLRYLDLAKAAIDLIMKGVLNPEQAIRKIRRRLFTKKTGADVQRRTSEVRCRSHI
jgi:glycosyltransferase involved in cell wall biosynthesis